MKDYEIRNMTGENVLITGGLGFLGSNLAHKLIDLGANVTVYTRTLDKIKNVKEIRDKLKIVLGDILDLEKVKECVKNQDYIFHFAGQISHFKSMSDPHLDIDVNCKGTINVLESCRIFNDTAKILFSGTRGEVGKPISNPVDETHREDPVDIYAVNKLAAEKYCLVYYKVYGIPVSSIRITNVFGPRQQMKHGEWGVLNFFIGKAMLEEPIVIYGKGEQLRDYNYVENVVDAFLLAAQSDKANGEVFMLGTNRGISLVDIVKLVIKIVGKGSYEHAPFPKEINKKLDIGDFVVNYSKINRLLDWYPKISLEEGLERTVEFYRERLNEYI
nr:GDP-mannose 4,6-dehydratase [Candidatus Freyarchaeota archaeon]